MDSFIDESMVFWVPDVFVSFLGDLESVLSSESSLSEEEESLLSEASEESDEKSIYVFWQLVEKILGNYRYKRQKTYL